MVRYNQPTFNDLHDQNKNSHRPYADHCASSEFAPMSPDAGWAFCIATEHDGINANSRTPETRTLV